MSAKPAPRRAPFSWRTFLIGAAMVIVAFLVNWAHPHLLEYLELKADDLRVSIIEPPPPTGQVVVAAIDDKSIAELGQWPWPRAIMARLVSALQAYRVKVIGFDVVFSETDERDVERDAIAARLRSMHMSDAAIRETIGPGNDDEFAEAIRAQGATVLAYAFGSHQFLGQSGARFEAGNRREMLTPPPMAYNIAMVKPGAGSWLLGSDVYLPPIKSLNQGARATAFVDIDADVDGVMRFELTAIRFHDRFCVPFYLAVLDTYRDGAPRKIEVDQGGVERVAIGDREIPVDEMGRMLVRFRGDAQTMPTYSISDLIARRTPPDRLAGRIVLVGMTAHGLGDRAVTPAGGEFPRVVIHANAIDNALRGDFLHRTQSTVGIAQVVAVVLGIAIAWATAAISALGSAAFAVLLTTGYFVYAQHRLASDGLLLGVVFPLFTAALTYVVLASYRYATEGREKRRLRHAFEHYLHPSVIASIVENPKQLKLGGERRVVSILFADIVNYTGLSERTDPAALVALLNDYMTKMTDLILETDGVVDKIRGDGIMAFWGAPKEVPNHARAAIDSALGMLAELSALKERDKRFADVDIGIGIATGEVIVGNFGGARRFDYSVIGDTVNLASRLESLTRQFKVRLLVSKATFTIAAGAYVSREIGLVRVKGKQELVDVMEIAGRADDGIDRVYYFRHIAALDLMRKGDAAAARDELVKLREERPHDEVVRMQLENLNAVHDRAATELVFEFDTK
jgi:adenylate cyclase